MRSVGAAVRLFVTVGGLSCTLAWASLAQAQAIGNEASPREDRPEQETSERWYGWQTLTIDGPAMVVFVGAAAADGDATPTLVAASAVGFALGPPIVHIVHERYWESVGSFTLRLATTGLGTFIGAQFSTLNPCPDMPGASCDEGDSTPLVAGALIGAATASAIDAAVLAYEPMPRASNEHRYGAPPALHLAPRIGFSRGTASFGLAGAF